ncbi:MAG: hypothetical protein V9E98_05575 [Candidatus Nanopelagicales bacterium]
MGSSHTIQVREVGGLERQPGEAAAPRLTDHDTGGPRLRAAQHQVPFVAMVDDEPEVTREQLGLLQVRLLELQPRQTRDLDQRIAGPAGVLTRLGALLAVQTGVGATRFSLDVCLPHGSRLPSVLSTTR